ncbi:hypothetical protein [Curtobacterium pusillum]|uniref:hypothetical protein n=1 Tax=Curtobacterium pusillum TaxID=69373 RepID=UPI00119DA396|nr:hypothetical protein [Curtobacterium pusillum]
MSSTPLFDSIARQTDAPSVAHSTISADSAPASPISSPASDPVLVPAALVAAIEAIPAPVSGTFETEHPVAAAQLVLVEAVADAMTRAVVDAVASELERIARDGFVRA